MPKYKRAESERSRLSEDDVGCVRVYVRMIDRQNSGVVAGNLSRSFTIHDVKVSKVARDIEQALFE